MKKKSKLLIVSLVGILILTGCSDKNNQQLDKNSTKKDSIEETFEEKTSIMNCTKGGVSETGAILDSEYEVTYRGLYVEKVRSVEKIISKNQEELNYFKEQILSQYDNYKNLEHYNYNVEIIENTLVSTIDIDYTKIDISRMLEINPQLKTILKNGKLKLKDLKSGYDALDIVCE